MASLFPPSQSLTISFDSQITVSRFQASPHYRNDFLCMDFDMWTELRRIKAAILFRVVFEWVQSHQDGGTPSSLLSDASRLNIQVDHLEGKISSTMTTRVPTISIPSSIITISINGVLHHHFPQRVIRQRTHSHALIKYIISKTGCSETEFHSIE